MSISNYEVIITPFSCPKCKDIVPCLAVKLGKTDKGYLVRIICLNQTCDWKNTYIFTFKAWASRVKEADDAKNEL